VTNFHKITYMKNLLVLYVFHVYNDRAKHFIEKCIFYDEQVDFVIISNDKNAKFLVPTYAKVLFRDNLGYDFGGWSEALLTNSLYQNYENFIFANSSIIGPFLNPDFKGKWTDIYLNGLKDNVKLFGSTINCCGNPFKAHVQSYIFAMDKTTLEYLIKCEIFSLINYSRTFEDCIWNKEVLMSRKIIDNGWNIGSLLPYYNGVDFTFKTKSHMEYRKMFEFQDDFGFEQHRNRLWNEYQLVFVKGNRDLKVGFP